MSLAALIKKGVLREIATAIPATSATNGGSDPPSVATVATVAVATVHDKAANDAPPEAVSEQYARAREAQATPAAPYRNWPPADTMSQREAQRCIDRRARFLASGQLLEDAERLADKLLIRDREGDDRRMCLECSHLRQSGRCIAARAGRLVGASRDLTPIPDLLQRCEAFGLRRGLV